jgi:hypothetical protein
MRVSRRATLARQVVLLRLHARDDVRPRQPALQVHVGAATGAERAIGRRCRGLLADRTQSGAHSRRMSGRSAARPSSGRTENRTPSAVTCAGRRTRPGRQRRFEAAPRVLKATRCRARTTSTPARMERARDRPAGAPDRRPARSHQLQQAEAAERAEHHARLVRRERLARRGQQRLGSLPAAHQVDDHEPPSPSAGAAAPSSASAVQVRPPDRPRRRRPCGPEVDVDRDQRRVSRSPRPRRP